MNDQMIRDLEKAIQEPIPEGVKLTIKDITDAVDAQDLHHQHQTFVTLLHLEANDRASRLHHRATMMRQRADEFDRLADDVKKQSSTTARQGMSVLSVIDEIEELLAAHAHIEPRRVG